MLLKYRIGDYKKWAEKNREKGSQFQSTLRVRFKAAAVGKTQLVVVREKKDQKNLRGENPLCKRKASIPMMSMDGITHKGLMLESQEEETTSKWRGNGGPRGIVRHSGSHQSEGGVTWENKLCYSSHRYSQ